MYASSEIDTSGTPHWTLSASSDADVCSGVARAFERAIDAPTRDALSALRVAVTEAGRSMRRSGVPPERAVIALKTVLARHGGYGWAPSLDAGPNTNCAESRVYAKLFHWFVAAFYDG